MNIIASLEFDLANAREERERLLASLQELDELIERKSMWLRVYSEPV